MKTKRRFGMLFDLRLHPASGKLPLVIFFCALLLSLLQDHSGWVTFSTQGFISPCLDDHYRFLDNFFFEKSSGDCGPYYSFDLSTFGSNLTPF
ncbi:hypothetical protein QR680_018272 [Steinernema hermaphroditum]|uniref:Uncharacterized protein n=1 Tax=Steinernema hermaphroditum TaxID=289476 RepID=A0AA39HJN6_9BILA|nr:hypothetical protein QR680_018272 [Steinernema hermaphroditum]